MNRSEQDRRLEELYAHAPAVNCAGECWTECSSIDMNPRERQRAAQAGIRIPDRLEMVAAQAKNDGTKCPALTEEHRCAVYSVRPMICRLWGSSKVLVCPWGCRPIEGRFLTSAETMELLSLSRAVGAGKDPFELPGRELLDQDPNYARLVRRGRYIDSLVRGSRSSAQ